jgi:hypothetical protein
MVGVDAPHAKADRDVKVVLALSKLRGSRLVGYECVPAHRDTGRLAGSGVA